MNYSEKIEKLLLVLPHKLQVSFALHSANDTFKYVRDQDKDVIGKCLNTIQLWLEDRATLDEVNTSYAAASAAAASAASYAAYSAAYAASAAIRHRADLACYAAVFYAAAVTDDREEQFKLYYDDLIFMIKNISELDKIIYNVEEP